MKRVLPLIVAILLLSGLPGCFLCGNGEPICGAKPDNGTSTGTGSPGQTTPVDTKHLRYFYQERVGYTCTPAGTSAAVASWVARITWDGEVATLSGDRCHPEGATLPGGSIEFSLRGDYLGYGESIFTRYDTEPPADAHPIPEAWCRYDDPRVAADAEIVVTSDLRAQFIRLSTATITLPFTRADASGLRVYTRGTTDLTIDLVPLSYPFEARIDRAPAGFSDGNLHCRIVP